MNKMLLFFDIDGTLAMPRSQPSDTVVQAIRAARLNGHKAFLSTGRSEASVPDGVAGIGFDGGIYSAGGRVIVGSTVLYDRPMPETLVHTVCEILKQECQPYFLECAGKTYRQKIELDDNGQAAWSGGSSELKRMLSCSDADAIDRYQGEPVYKISFIAPDRDQVDRISERIGDAAKVICFGNSISGPGYMVGEISDKCVNKGLALRKICAYYGMETSQCIAFGDSMNDAEILFAAGIGIAMADSEECVKSFADDICGTCAEDGVAKALVRLGLIRELVGGYTPDPPLRGRQGNSEG